MSGTPDPPIELKMERTNLNRPRISMMEVQRRPGTHRGCDFGEERVRVLDIIALWPKFSN
jgi:hypothetical protein